MQTQTNSHTTSTGGWKIGQTIGSGATATVSIATDTISGDLFAVKSSPIGRSSLLQREKGILSSLSSPHIISLLGFDISGDSYNLFLEFADCGAIADLPAPLDEHKIQSFTRQILLGLSYLHSKGIAHGDVKGQNVLLCSDGRVKLADFGCARRGSDRDRDWPAMGTPAFMAPESVRGEEQGVVGDVWSLGCTIVEMATGKSPWPDATTPAAAIRRISFSTDVPAMPEWFSEKGKDFVLKCLRRDWKERWSVEQLLCHPFVEEAKDELFELSPKSVIEFNSWDLEAEEEEEEEIEEGLDLIEVGLRERIRCIESSAASWEWDDSWIEIVRFLCD